MSYTIDILEPVLGDPDTSISNLGRMLGTLYHKHWEQHQRAKFGDLPFNLNVQALVTGWLNRVFKIFLAVEDDTKEATGFMVCMRYRPMCYDAEAFTFVDWVAKDNEQRRALFDYAMNAVKILGVTELIIPKEMNFVPQGWKQFSEDTVIRYARQ